MFYSTLKDILEIALDIHEVPKLVTAIRGTDPFDLYIQSLRKILDIEKEVFKERSINLVYDFEIFNNKLIQQGIDFSELPVASTALDELITNKLASILLEDDFIRGVDIDIDIDLGWAKRIIQATNRQYAKTIYEKLSINAIKNDLDFISTSIKDNPILLEKIERLIELFETIIAQFNPDLDNLTPTTVENLFGKTAKLIEFEKIKPATQERLTAYYQGARLSWDIIAANGDVERDLQRIILNKYLNRPEKFKILCIAGEPAAGKSTLAWKISEKISRVLRLPLIHLRADENDDFWFSLENSIEKFGKPIIVLIDDIFRDANIVKILSSINPDTPIFVVSTSRINEIPNDLLIPMEFDLINLQGPTNNEIERAFNKVKFKGGFKEKKNYQKHKIPSWLVLMYKITVGEEFRKYIYDSVKRLRRQDRITFNAYEYLCFAGLFDLMFPISLFERLDRSGSFFEIWNRPSARGLIYHCTEPYPSLYVQHAVIAKFALAVYKRDPQNIFNEIVDSIDDLNNEHRIFINLLCLRLIKFRLGYLIKCNLEIKNNKELFTDYKSVTELTIWIKIYTSLEYSEKVKKLEKKIVEFALIGNFASISEWETIRQTIRNKKKVYEQFLINTLLWIENNPDENSLLYKLIFELSTNRNNEINYKAIDYIGDWLINNPNENLIRYEYIKLVEKKGNIKHIIDCTQNTEKWLTKKPNYFVIWQAYIELVEKRGKINQVNKTIQMIIKWLSLEKFRQNKAVLQSFLLLVERRGNQDQVNKAISTIREWLKQNPTDYQIRQFYLRLIECKGNLEQIMIAIEDVNEWFKKNPFDTVVRQAFIRLIKRKGNRIQVQNCINEMIEWLEISPAGKKILPDVARIIRENGDQNQHQALLRIIVNMIAKFPYSKEIRKIYLELLYDEGNSDQIRDGLLQTKEWLYCHALDRNLLIQYIELSIKSNDPDLINYAIQTIYNQYNKFANPNVYLSYIYLLQRFGKYDQIQEAISQIDVIPIKGRQKSKAIRQLLYLVKERGTKDQVEKIIIFSKKWVDFHSTDLIVLLAYLQLIIDKGTDEQIINEINRVRTGLENGTYDSISNSQKIFLYSKLGRMLLETGNIDEAERFLLEVLFFSESNISARITYSWCLYLQGERTEAFKEMQFALNYSKEYPKCEIYFQLGCLYYFDENYQKAKENYLKAIKHNVNTIINPYRYYRELGRILFLQKCKKAILFLEKARESVQDFYIKESEMIELDLLILEAKNLL